MAFNAGAIEATLTLNRNPFTAGLAAARNQARQFARERYEATARIKVDQVSFNAAVRQLESFAKQSRAALAKVNVDRLMFDKLVRDLREFGRQTYTARARVNIGDSNSLLNALNNGLNRLGDTADNNGRRLFDFGNQGHRAFSHMDGSVRALLMTLPLILPVAGSAITGVIGLVGGLVSILAVAGFGAAAFGAVAVPVFNRIKDAVAAGQAEIDKLPLGLREAGNALRGLQENYNRLVEATQTPVGFAMAAGFRAASAALGPLQPLIVNTANTLTQIGERMTQYFNSAHYRDFVNFVAGNINPVLTRLFEIVAYGTRGVMNLSQAFMPLGQWILDRVSAGMQRFAEWTGNLANDQRFHKWLELVKESLTAVWEFLVSVTQFLFNLSNALAPVGNVILRVLTGIFDALNRMPPEWLAAIAGGLSAVMAALLVGAGPGVAAVAGVITGVAFALTSLYNSSERVRGAIDPIFNTLRDLFLPIFQQLVSLFEQRVVPAFQSIGDTLIEDLLPAFNTFLQSTGPFIAFFTEQVGVLAVDALGVLLEIVDYTLKEISSALRFWAAVFRGDWDAVWQEVQVSFGLKTDLIKTLFGDMWNDITTTLTEEGQIISTEWTNIWAGLQTTATTEGGILTTEWNGIWESLKTTLFEEGEILKSEWTSMWESLKTTLIEEGEILKADWNGMWSSMRTTLQEEDAILDQEWNNLWVGFQTTLVEEAEILKAEWNGAWQSVKTTAIEEWNILRTEWTTAWQGFITTLQEEGEILKAEWNGIWESVRLTFIEERTQLDNEWRTAWADIQTTLREEGAILSSEWSGLWASVKQTAIEEWGLIQAEVTGIVNSIQTTLSEEWEIIKADWNGMLNSIKQTAIEEWEIIKGEFQRGVNAVKGVINGMIDTINAVFRVVGVAEIPKLEAGGTVTMVPQFAKGGNLFDEIGPGFITNGPKAIVGEGNSKYPEYVIPTDPKYRGRAGNLFKSLGSDLGLYADGGIIGGMASAFGLPSLDSVLGSMAGGIGITTGPWLGIAQGVAKKVWDGVVKKVTDAIASMGGLLGGGTGGGGVGWMMGVLRTAFPGLPLISGLRPGAITATGNPSYHGMGRAVDLPPRMDVFNWIKANFGANTRELIFSPAGGGQVWNGRPHMYGEPTRGDHWDHVHWAYDDGGWLPPGDTTASNKTGSPEAVLTEPQWNALMSGSNSSDIIRKLDELIEVLDRKKLDVTINVDKDGKTTTHGDRLALRLGRR